MCVCAQGVGKATKKQRDLRYDHGPHEDMIMALMKI